ncbi:MAG: NnrU family protein [Marivibrio sp.]|uniref:NnrU family protein n=1 Tax=Marivibrio sp. TaxID=2039719 RepID=UPI0032EAC621
MDPAFTNLLTATASFVGGHFLLSSLPVRMALVERIGANAHRILYSIVAAATIYWMVSAYNDAPYFELWAYSTGLRHLQLALMFPACLLLAAAVTSRSPTAVGGEKMLSDPKPPAGVLTVTRHPMLWAFLIWAIAHLLGNGDVASVIFFGGFAVLSAGGMAHIDFRRQATTGSDWGPIALGTSAIPFLAALQGRTKVDWAGIGVARLALGVALYAALLVLHPYLAGVALVDVF